MFYYSPSTNSPLVCCFHCNTTVCNSSVILRRLDDLPVITWRSLSCLLKKTSHAFVFCCRSVRAHSNSLVFILQTAWWVRGGCQTVRSSCDEHADHTVGHSGGGVPGRLSSGSVSHLSELQTTVAPSMDRWEECKWKTKLQNHQENEKFWQKRANLPVPEENKEQ